MSDYLIVSGVFLLVGIIGRIRSGIIKSRCTETVEATVVLEREAEIRSGHCYYKYHFDKYPTFSYTYKGRKYTRKSNYYSITLDFNIGDKLELCIDPNNPERFYCPKEQKSRFNFDLISIGIGVFLMIIFFVNVFIR